VSTTIWGTASKIGAIAAGYSRWGELVDAHSYDELAVELPEGGVSVDLDHDDQAIGRLVYGEIAEDGRLNCVAVLDDDTIRQVEQDVFWSPTFVMVGDVRHRSYIAREAQLLGLSLTLSPATLGAAPIRWREGDVRDPASHRWWPMSWRSDQLLERAANSVAGSWRLRSRVTERLVDRRPDIDAFPFRRVRACAICARTSGYRTGSGAPAPAGRSSRSVSGTRSGSAAPRSRTPAFAS
jgi:hypothetical protein